MQVLATWKQTQCIQSMGGCREGVTVGAECSVKAEVLPKGSSRESSPEERDCGPLTGSSWKGGCSALVERPRHSSRERKHSKPLWEAGSLEQVKGKAAERAGTASSGRDRVKPRRPGEGILPGSWGALKGFLAGVAMATRIALEEGRPRGAEGLQVEESDMLAAHSDPEAGLSEG